MTEEATPEDPDEVLGAYFTASYVGGIVHDELNEIRASLNSAIDRMQYLLPYLTGMYYTDRQRQMAEAQMFQLNIQVNELADKLSFPIHMAVELHRPVSLSYT